MIEDKGYFMRQLSAACRLSIFCVVALCSGCAVVALGDAVVAVGGAVVTTGAVIVTTGVKATGAVVNAVIP